MGCNQCTQQDKVLTDLLSPTEAYTSIVRKQIEDYPVLLYSATDCEESQAIKKGLRVLHIPFEYFEVDHMILRVSGLTSTPVLYIRGKVVGGLEELQQLIETGQLFKRLDAMGVSYRKLEGKTGV